MPTTAAENPHWGIAGLPFMNSITRPRVMVSAMRLRRSSVTVQLLLVRSLALIFFRRRGGQRERVNRRGGSGDRVAERGIDQAVALDRTLADERRRDHGRVEVVAAAGRVPHADVGVGQGGADAGANVVRCHGRRQAKTLSARVYSTQGRFAPALYSTLAMTLGTRVTLVTTTVIASVLAGSGYAALKVRRANLEADLGREAFEIATALRAGIEPVTAKGDALSEMLHGRIRAAREPNEVFQLEVLSGGADEKT